MATLTRRVDGRRIPQVEERQRGWVTTDVPAFELGAESQTTGISAAEALSARLRKLRADRPVSEGVPVGLTDVPVFEGAPALVQPGQAAPGARDAAETLRQRLNSLRTPEERARADATRAADAAEVGVEAVGAVGAQIQALQEQMARMFEVVQQEAQRGERMEVRQIEQGAQLADVQTGVRGIAARADEILGVTKEIKKNTDALKNAYASGGAGGVLKEIINNEKLMFVLYFMVHPQIPITAELAASVWCVYAGVRRTYLTVVRQETDLDFKSLVGVAYSVTLSQASLIYLLWNVVQLHSDMRINNPQEYETLFPNSSAETFVYDALANARGDLLAEELARNVNVTEITPAIRRGVETLFSANEGSVWAIVNATCPTLASDKTKFIQCFVNFILRNLGNTAMRILSAPAYLSQIEHVTTAYAFGHGLILQYLLMFLWKLAQAAGARALPAILDGFKVITTMMTNYAGGLICGLPGMSTWLAVESCKAFIGKKAGGRRIRRIGGDGDQLMLQMQAVKQMSMQMQVVTQLFMNYAVYRLVTIEFRERFGGKRIAPHLKNAYEVIAVKLAMILSHPLLVPEPRMTIEDIKSVMSDRAFKASGEDVAFLGGVKSKKKIHRKTRRSMVKLRSTRRRR